MAGYKVFSFNDRDEFFVIDQRELPRIVEVKLESISDVSRAISDMLIRGAPLIGIVAAFGLYLAIKDSETLDELLYKAKEAYSTLLASRPTAVNLKWALDSQNRIIEENLYLPAEKIIKKVRENAFEIYESQIRSDKQMAENGLLLFNEQKRILTHCNTGSFATGGFGTALGIIKHAAKKNFIKEIFVDETRPYLQGSRITALELSSEAIDYKIVTDSACGILMQKKMVDMVVVGADRISKNGDVANKIGTYCIAQMSRVHNVEFIVAAPESTIDRNLSDLSSIEIEVRSSDEILNFRGIELAPRNAEALYYAFDITPSSLINAIVTEKAVYRPPFDL